MLVMVTMMRLTLTLAMAQAVITARLCTRMVSSRKLTWTQR